jgi:uncharacterized protein YjbI with pentapeptide repeats
MADRLRDRWSPSQIEAALTIVRGTAAEGPFGRTTEGYNDLRGLPIESLLRPDGVSLSRCDFSRLNADGRVIFANTQLLDCLFEDARIRWGDYCSTINVVSLRRARMAGSIFASSYVNCDFSGADISGSTGTKPTFTKCLFDQVNFMNCVIRDCAFIDCKFIGNVEGAIFGGDFGKMEGCDFTQASFVDCAFNNFRFDGCKFSETAIVFQDWQLTLDALARQLDHETSPAIVKSGRKWLEIWNERRSITPSNLIDLADQIRHEGPEVGSELFRIFKGL